MTEQNHKHQEILRNTSNEHMGITIKIDYGKSIINDDDYIYLRFINDINMISNRICIQLTSIIPNVKCVHCVVPSGYGVYLSNSYDNIIINIYDYKGELIKQINTSDNRDSTESEEKPLTDDDINNLFSMFNWPDIVQAAVNRKENKIKEEQKSNSRRNVIYKNNQNKTINLEITNRINDHYYTDGLSCMKLLGSLVMNIENDNSTDIKEINIHTHMGHPKCEYVPGMYTISNITLNPGDEVVVYCDDISIYDIVISEIKVSIEKDELDLIANYQELIQVNITLLEKIQTLEEIIQHERSMCAIEISNYKEAHAKDVIKIQNYEKAYMELSKMYQDLYAIHQQEVQLNKFRDLFKF